MSQKNKEKGFFGSLVSIALPIAGQNLISNAVGLTDTLMIGTLGEDAVSATSLANRYIFIFSLVMFGIVSGANVLSAQYWGRKDTDSIGKIIAIALKLSIISGVVFSIAALVVPEYIIYLFTDDAQVIKLGASYLRIVAPAILFNAVTFTYVACLRSVEKVGIGIATQAQSFFINLIVNAVLIFGLFGFPKLGVAGAAIGVLAARTGEVILTVIYARCNKLVKVRLKDIIKCDKRLFRDFIKYSAPVVANESLWGLGTSMHSVIYGHISSSVVAAFNVVSSIQNVLTVVGFGVSSAAAVIIGKSVGQSMTEKAKKEANALVGISLLFGIIEAGLVLGVRAFAFDIGIFDMSESTISLMKTMMILTAGFVLFQTVNCTLVVGILRGGGDTKFAFVLDTCFMWIMSLPLGAAVAFWLKAPPIAVMGALYLEEVFKTIIGIWRMKSGKWITNLTRDRAEEQNVITN